MDSRPTPKEPAPKFRINAKVFQILGLLGVALALPITILTLGIIGILNERQPTSSVKPQAPESVAEVPGLRQSLEFIADANMPIVPVESPMRLFNLRSDNPAQKKQKRIELLDFFKGSTLPFLETGTITADSWIVKVEPINAESFENGLNAIGFQLEVTGGEGAEAKGDTSKSIPYLYKITIEPAEP